MKTFGLVNIWRFYRDGFREMTWGRTLWILILVKLFVLFAVLRVFFSGLSWPVLTQTRNLRPWPASCCGDPR